MALVFTLMFIVTVVISWLWTSGIDKMKREHPDYKGEDFSNWDEDKTHTEGEL